MRKSKLERKTTETQIKLDINIDGEGNSSISTGIPFFDHMLTLFSKHGCFDIELSVTGDIEVDHHHTVEDTGICLGQAIKEALGNKAGIKRYGNFMLPMDEALCTCALDISNRPFLVYNASFSVEKTGTFDVQLANEFLQAFVNSAGICLHINVLYGENAHHIIEAIFKALARALREAISKDEKIKGIPSTKGLL